MIRTHEAGTLRGENAGEHVVLAGWVARRRDHGGVVFIDLRDASGTVQVVLRSDDATEHSLRAEFCVRVTGTVRARPAGNENPELPTGAIEVVVEELEVLSEADPLPFPVEGNADVNEDIRIKYRYLDIRREETARALKIRSTAAWRLTRQFACATDTSTFAPSACRRTCACGRRSTARCASRWKSRASSRSRRRC